MTVDKNKPTKLGQEANGGPSQRDQRNINWAKKGHIQVLPREETFDGNHEDLRGHVYTYDGYAKASQSVSYTHLRAHETREDLVCRLLLEKKK